MHKLLSRRSLTRLRWMFGILASISLAVSMTAFLTPFIPAPWVWHGLSLLFLGLWLEQMMLYSYNNYWYFQGMHGVIGQKEVDSTEITYDVATIAENLPQDLTKSFFEHPIGLFTLRRTGIAPEEWEQFINSPDRYTLNSQEIEVTDQPMTVFTLGLQIMEKDTDLQNFLAESGINIAHLRGALRWVYSEYRQDKLQERWWSKDVLLRTQGIGRSWSFGYTKLLNRYLKPVRSSAVFSVFHTVPQYAEEKVDEVSEVLMHEKAGNALILGEAGVGKLDVVVALETRIEQNRSIAGLQHKRVAILDTERILAESETPNGLEQTLIDILTEATNAGNSIIVIENLSSLITTTENRGVHIADILDTYLSHPAIQFIATDTPGAFHTHLQPLGALTRRFGQVVIDIPDTDTVVRILSKSCREVEKTHKVFFTYPALINIAQGAKRYITDGTPPDSALTLMVEIAGHHSGTKTIINTELVQEYITNKTGIPAGEVSEEERDVLLNLEDTLHQHVVGQDVAIKAIADTIRRSRVGVQTSERPIGSFLFLGPTGVGKTETAKTLAKVFFGSPEEMVRFDMSEYSQSNALERLLGSEEQTGTLSDTLHDKPYTVLLLDEFEKANPAVHDLFLQILDEGTFTDGRGTQVNARNTIIIATSNAGANLIYKTGTQRQENVALNQEIINHIIKIGAFRPELINRFDNTIIFEPLQESQQQRVAEMMLNDLINRMREKGYRLSIETDVAPYLADTGYSATFGGRAMRRVIQNTVESVLAEKIINEKLRPGDTITLERNDILPKNG